MNIFHFYLLNANIKSISLFLLNEYMFEYNKILKMHKCMRLWGCMDECIDCIWNCFFYFIL